MPDTPSIVYSFLPYIVAATVSYLAGSIPFGFLIARSQGVDIRTVGSKNIGANNVYRVLGRKFGVTTFVCDFLKGLFPLMSLAVLDESTPSLKLVCAIGAVLGHLFPVWLGFKGGKGVATGAGVVVGLTLHMPLVLICAVAVFVATVAISHYVSLGSILAAVTVGATSWVFNPDAEVYIPAILTLLAALVVVRHHSNIARLLKGTENRFSFKK